MLDLGSAAAEPTPALAFIADEALVRFCTEDYHTPSSKNMHLLLSHLTNFTLNKLSTKFSNSENLDQESQESASKRTLTSLFEQLREQGINTDQIFESIREVCTKVLGAIHPFCLLQQRRKLDMDSAKGDCYQIIGIDVFIDKNLKAWALEINDSPSLNINLTKEGGVGQGLITLPSEVDKYIKSKIVGSTLNMMLKTKSKKRGKRLEKRMGIEKFECWEKM